MKTFLVDTNAILRFLLGDVPSQFRLIKAKVNEVKIGKLKLVVPEIIFFESYFTLTSHYNYSKEKVLVALESLASSNYFEVENRDFILKGLKIFKSANLSFVDYYLASRSGIEGYDIFTFDKKLEKYAKSS